MDIEAVVREICGGCAAKGYRVSEILAAFIARTVLESNPNEFSLDSSLSNSDVNKLIDYSIQRLMERDNPSLETIKMQVGFDTCYVRLEEDLQAGRRNREMAQREQQRAILAVRPRGGSDFETLTTLYRQIFAYLLSYYDGPGEKDRNVEREVAAALESVFPRIGLKSFVLLSPEEKRAQLDEMAKIVLGIRLFNREMGKGGAGLPNTEELVFSDAMEIKEALEAESQSVQDLCNVYQETIVYVHVKAPPAVTEKMAQRWKEELANRRQYLSYLQSLQEDISVSLHKIQTERETFVADLKELEVMVGGRSSVPKEHVYPKFEDAAISWLKLVEEAKVVSVRRSTLMELQDHSSSYHTTLTSDSPIVYAAKAQKAQSMQEEEKLSVGADDKDGGAAEDKLADGGGGGGGGGDAAAASAAQPKGGDEGEFGGEAKGGGAKGDDAGDMYGGGTDGGGERPVKLSIESTPEFMQLPLEYQGFCPWTMVNRHGLLLPGKPAIGVVRYMNMFFVFAHATALNAFMRAPDDYKAGVLLIAQRSPELIHLLRLQNDFPNHSISKLINAGKGGIDEAGEEVDAPLKKDASTETPLHFVEKNMDVNYEWNEWALRRRALQMTNIRKCVTTGQQTDNSHFRRENDSQVYLPRQKDTQTMKTSATQPPITIQYTAGLRGTPAGALPSRYAKEATGKPGRLNMVLEPGAKEGHLVIGGRSNAF